MVEFLNFLPVQSFEALVAANPGKASELKRRAEAGDEKPYSVLFLGAVGDLGEVYVSLTQPYSLPAETFKVAIRAFDAEETGDDAPDADNRRLVAEAHAGTRIGRLNPLLTSLLHQKWIIHWTGLRPMDLEQ